jgi:hypothetical protein
MSMKTMGAVDQSFGFNSANLGMPQCRVPEERQSSRGGDFGISPDAGAQPVRFGEQPSRIINEGVHAVENACGSNAQRLSGMVDDLLEKILHVIALLMQKNPTDKNASLAGSGQSQGASAAEFEANHPMLASTAPQHGDTAPSEETVPASTVISSDPLIAAEPTASLKLAGESLEVRGPITAGSGPYSLEITNAQDRSIKIGQFNKDEKLVGELALEPGQKGTMKYEAETTGLLKQADAEGNYKPDASRLEFYNGFINTSDIDGRNAAIYVTDGKGFEIGDKQSIADKAPSNITSIDFAGNKTLAGWYDGSTERMKQGGEFLTKELGTGMTYQHPNDDTLAQGQNPMRHTDSMTLDVVFGRA